MMKKIGLLMIGVFLVAITANGVWAKNKHQMYNHWNNWNNHWDKNWHHRHPTQARPGNPVIDYLELLDFNYTDTVITDVTMEPEGNRPEHCVVNGYMNQRISPVDGNTYQIGFQMRLPTNWCGRYYYQANGGIDGSVTAAFGNLTGGGSALDMGFAVISSDTGHGPNPAFGMDPQARINYGYNAVALLTPLAKQLIKTYYGRFPDKSYFAGCSNGGRHTMVAASRYADEYDGFFAGAPGFNLPQAAVAQLWGAQQYATISDDVNGDGRPDISSSFSPEDLAVVSDAVLTACDEEDGLADGMVSDPMGCQECFNIMRDVETSEYPGDPGRLTYGQKSVLARIIAGAKNSKGEALYANFLWDPGIGAGGWNFWEYTAPVYMDSGAVGFIFATPPKPPTGLDWVLNWDGTGFDVDRDAPKIYATDDVYTESSMSFMTPPDLLMKQLHARGGKLIVVHGTADAVFSAADTVNWYESLSAHYKGRTKDFARLFLVPGMGHCSGGPSCDRFELFQALIDWVEKGIAPDAVASWTNPGNPEAPQEWKDNGRTRKLCAYPAFPYYNGGDVEDASSFECQCGQ